MPGIDSTNVRIERDVYQESAEDKARFASQPHRPTRKTIDFSLFYFGSDAGDQRQDEYRMLIEGAQFADKNGFSAVWTPERHFHAVGGLYPNPALTGIALATTTQRIQIRAGSVVMPLHNPLRVAEEWSVVDNFSNGRVAISFASGWQANDFAIAPENFSRRKEIMFQGIEAVRRLWRGEPIKATNGLGDAIDVKIFPKPIQPELPVWLTSSGHADTFKMAGEFGFNVLTHLFGQGIQQLAEKIEIYRTAWRNNGHGPEGGRVTVMLHTFLWENLQVAHEKVRKPLREYLRTYRDLSKNAPTANGGSFTPDTRAVERLLDEATDRYIESSGLFGSPDHCLKMVQTLSQIGADEIACLIDFGVDTDSVLASLEHLNELRTRCNPHHNGTTSDRNANNNGSPSADLVTRRSATPLPDGDSLAQTSTPSGQMLPQLRAILGELSGLDHSPTDDSKTFMEQGFESLQLAQLSLLIEKRFSIRVPFRRLFENANSLLKLADHIESQLPRQHSGTKAQHLELNLENELRQMSDVEQQLTHTLGIKDIASYPRLESELNDLCSAYICEYLKSCHITLNPGQRYSYQELNDALSIRPGYERFLRYMLTVLAHDGIVRLASDEIEWLRRPDLLPKSSDLHNRLLKRYPDFSGLLEMLRHCAAHYREALAGEILGVSVLLPGGRHDLVKEHLQHYTDHHKCTRIYEGVAQSLVLNLSQKSPLNILEVGGGGGELTWQLAPELAGSGSKYHFSDIGRTFVQNARQEAARRRLGFMNFGVLDVSKDPIKQGYEANSYHVILALNVIHATPDVGEALAHLKKLLVPGGLLCLVELTRYHRWDNMIIGLAEGWWLYSDFRKDSPLLQIPEWEQVFRRQGFKSLSAFPSASSERDQTDAGLILAQSDQPNTAKADQARQSPNYFVATIISIITVFPGAPTPLTFTLEAAGALCGL